MFTVIDLNTTIAKISSLRKIQELEHLLRLTVDNVWYKGPSMCYRVMITEILELEPDDLIVIPYRLSERTNVYFNKLIELIPDLGDAPMTKGCFILRRRHARWLEYQLTVHSSLDDEHPKLLLKKALVFELPSAESVVSRHVELFKEQERHGTS